MGIVVVLMLTDTQLTFDLTDIGRMNLKPVDLFHISFNVVYRGKKSEVNIKIHWVNSDLNIVRYLFPPKQTTVSAPKHCRKPDTHYREMLENYAAFLGIPEEEMSFLKGCDLTDTDLELALYDPYFRESCLEMFGYYGETEEEYDYCGCYAW